VTWRNINNTFSKDIVTNGGLTLAEMNANMIAYQLATNTDSIRANASNMINGNPYFVGGSGTSTASPPALYYWSGTAWVQKAITCSGHTLSDIAGPGITSDQNTYVCAVYNDSGNIGLITKEIIDGFAQYSQFRSSNNGDSWEFIEQLTTSSANHMSGQIAHNAQDFTKNLFLCLEDVGNSNWNLFTKQLSV
jgi:hypothetical protein